MPSFLRIGAFKNSHMSAARCQIWPFQGFISTQALMKAVVLPKVFMDSRKLRVTTTLRRYSQAPRPTGRRMNHEAWSFTALHTLDPSVAPGASIEVGSGAAAAIGHARCSGDRAVQDWFAGHAAGSYRRT